MPGDTHISKCFKLILLWKLTTFNCTYGQGDYFYWKALLSCSFKQKITLKCNDYRKFVEISFNDVVILSAFCVWRCSYMWVKWCLVCYDGAPLRYWEGSGISVHKLLTYIIWVHRLTHLSKSCVHVSASLTHVSKSCVHVSASLTHVSKSCVHVSASLTHVSKSCVHVSASLTHVSNSCVHVSASLSRI